MFFKWSSALCVGAVLFNCLVTPVFGGDLDNNEVQEKKHQLEEKIDQISKEKSKIDKQVKDVKIRKSQKLGIKKNLDTQVTQKKNEIISLNKKITMLNRDISKTTNEINDKEKEIADHKNLLNLRIKTGYMTPSATQIECLTNRENFADALTFIEFTAKITDHDKNIINSLNDSLNEIKDKKRQVEDNKRQVELSKAKIETVKNELDKQVAEVNEEVYTIEKQEAAYLKNAANLKKQMEELQAEIARICVEQSEDSPYVGGEFAWPVPGYYSISSPYGPRSFDGFHTGTDIAGKGIYGKNVIAANDGKVTFINTTGKGPYGNYVMISHGGGIVTLYAHLSGFNCSFGQTVSKGQTIGFIGSTGFSTGPHLHFEVRINGKHTNPMAYFKKK